MFLKTRDPTVPLRVRTKVLNLKGVRQVFTYCLVQGRDGSRRKVR